MPHVPESAQPGLRWFQWACRAYATVPLMVGSTIALTGGAGLDLVFGTDLGVLDPSLQSHVHFLAANFAEMGLILVWSTADVVARSSSLRIVFGAMIVGAILRIFAFGFYGPPSTFTTLVIGGELSAAPLLLWHARILRQLQSPN